MIHRFGVAAIAGFTLVLTACSSGGTSSSCGSTGLTAKVMGHSNVGLLSCSGLADITPLPAFTVEVGATVKVTGHGYGFGDLTVRQSSGVVSIDGHTVRARSAGTATIIGSKLDCVADRTGHQPTTCPLFTVTVP